MNRIHALVGRSVRWVELALCRVRLAVQRRRDRAELASLSSYELRDIGMSHADAIPVRAACCS
jgi:uncharacterized protein YjiS (DUF1127 family)